MSMSFPYLTISRQLGVPYKDVLLIADMLDVMGLFDPVITDRMLYCHVEQAWLREQNRRVEVR
jgi:hypothetical protein